MGDQPRLNFHIPRKSKEKRALIQNVPTESREYSDICKIITSAYKDPSSWGSYQYTKLRAIHSELLDKEFVEKRREMKMEGRSEKEMQESYCFLLCESYRLQSLCERGLYVGHSWMNLLGNPSKGVYLSKYSDILQINPFEPGATGELFVFKVIKGKMKSIHDNMARSLDPTPKFDSHISKNFFRVESHRSYRAFEHTQQYFYEYKDVDVRARPRHVCPYAVVTFQFKSKESTTLTKPLPPLRSNSLTSPKEPSHYVVWSGHLTNGGKQLFNVSFQSISQPSLPFKLPDTIEIGTVMRMDQLKLKIPPTLFSWDLYSGSQEVFKTGTHCCLLQVVERSKCTNSLTVLLCKLERERLVLVNTLTDRGFFLLLTSAQLTNPSERREGWKGSNLHVLFVFPESRDVSKCSAKPPPLCRDEIHPHAPPHFLPEMDVFVPALHFALNKARGNQQANPPANPSTAVTQQLCDYLSGQREGKLLPRVHVDYDIKLDERERLFPAPRNKPNIEAFLRSYLYCPNLYCIQVASARALVGKVQRSLEGNKRRNQEDQGGLEACLPVINEDPEKVQQLLKLIKIQKQQAGNTSEVVPAPILKRKQEEEAEESEMKKFRTAGLNAAKQEDVSVVTTPSLEEVISLVGLTDTDFRKNKTQGALKLIEMLDKCSAATAPDLGSLEGTMEADGFEDDEEEDIKEESEDEPAPLDPLEESIVKLGLPLRRDVDLREHDTDLREHDTDLRNRGDKEDTDGLERLEEASVESMSSLEAFSPSSDHGLQRGTNILGEKSIPWVLIPITGIKTERYSQRQWDNPQDPRLHATADPQEVTHNTGSVIAEMTEEAKVTTTEEEEIEPMTEGEQQEIEPMTVEEEHQPEAIPFDKHEETESIPVAQHQSLEPTSVEEHIAREPALIEEHLVTETSPLEEHQDPEPIPSEEPQETNPTPEDEPQETIPTPVEEPPELEVIPEARLISSSETAPSVEEPPQSDVVGHVEESVQLAEKQKAEPCSAPLESKKDVLEVHETTKELKHSHNPEPLTEITQQQNDFGCKVSEQLVEPHISGSVDHVKQQQQQQQQPQSLVDSIVGKQINDFSAGVKNLLNRRQVAYQSPSLAPPTATTSTTHVKPFSDYVSNHHTPMPLYGFVRTLRNSLTTYIDSHCNVYMPEAHSSSTAFTTIQPAFHHPSPNAAPCTSASGFSSASKPNPTLERSVPFLHRSSPPHPSLINNPHLRARSVRPPESQGRLGTCKEQPPLLLQDREDGPPNEVRRRMVEQGSTTPRLGFSPRESNQRPEVGTQSQLTESSPSVVYNPNAASSRCDPNPASSAGGEPSAGSSSSGDSGSSLTTLINKLNPEIYSNLMEIIKGVRKNSVQFYVHSGDDEDHRVNTEVKERNLSENGR